MAMPPYAYLAARRSAGHHVQVKLDKKMDVTEPAAKVGVHVTVERVFRGRRLRPGTRLRFEVPVYLDERAVPSGAARWISASRFLGVQYLEVFLDWRRGDWAIAASGAEYYVIDEPTDNPTVRRPRLITVWRARRRFRS